MNLSALNTGTKIPINGGSNNNSRPNKARKDDKKSSNDKKDDTSTMVNTKGPPPSTNIKTHVKVMMVLRGRGKCGYCGLKGHYASKCFYLVDSPPEGWNPKLEIWCYS